MGNALDPRRINPAHDLMQTGGNLDPVARYRSGWWFVTNEQTGDKRPEAYLMPADDTWADVYPAATWWQAMAKAISLANATLDCIYEGGPDAAN